MQHDVLLLSVRPKFASRILAGTKTIELRRVRPHVLPGHLILIYSSTPVMALMAVAEVDAVLTNSPSALWTQVKSGAGVTQSEFQTYFRGASFGVAIKLRSVERLSEPVPLGKLRERWPWFRPPQSYCYVRAQVDRQENRLAALEPRLTE